MTKPLLVNKTFDYDDALFIRRKTMLKTVCIHWHDFYEIEIVVSGRGKTVINGKEYALKRGECFFLTPQDLHYVEYYEKTDMITLHFSAGSTEIQYINRVMNGGEKAVSVSDKDMEKLTVLCELIKKENSEKNKNNEYISHLFESVLLVLAKYVSSPYDLKIHPPHVQKAIMYIQSHFSENPSLEEVADMMFLNKCYFATLFKKHVGKSFKEYLKCIKLDYAAGLLRTTLLPVTEVASRSGYGSISNFNREFKSFFNISPTQMRN